MAKEKEAAKALLARGAKDEARAVLRRKQRQETLLTDAAGKLDAIEALVERVEASQLDAGVARSLEAGNEALQALQKVGPGHRLSAGDERSRVLSLCRPDAQELSVEYVQKLMDDAQDGIDHMDVRAPPVFVTPLPWASAHAAPASLATSAPRKSTRSCRASLPATWTTWTSRRSLRRCCSSRPPPWRSPRPNRSTGKCCPTRPRTFRSPKSRPTYQVRVCLPRFAGAARR